MISMKIMQQNEEKYFLQLKLEKKFYECVMQKNDERIWKSVEKVLEYEKELN